MSIEHIGDAAQTPGEPDKSGSSPPRPEEKHLQRTVAFQYKEDDARTPPVTPSLHEHKTRPSESAQVEFIQQLTAATCLLDLPGYELLGELGRGGMGVVYKARHCELNRVVALKMILAGGHASADDLQRFVGEAEAVATLQHRNIIQVYEIGHHRGLPYMAFEYAAGGSLAARLRGTPLPAEQAARLVKGAAEGMHAAHLKGIVHRDLKPGNILLARIDDDRSEAEIAGARKPGTQAQQASFVDHHSPKITDFGLAKREQKSSGLTLSGAVMGTPSYMAPEQASGDAKRVGPPADIYALGAVLYECLTGRPPFHGPTPVDTVMQVTNNEPVPPAQLQPNTPRDLETICLKCLHQEPGKRYESAAALADDLERFRNDRPILARPSRAIEKCWRWCRRNPVVAVLSASVAVLLLVLAIGSLIAALMLDSERRELEIVNVSLDEARKDAVDKLWKSYLAQARAGRWSGHPGRRFESLEALARAAEIRPSLELRNEALAGLALPDRRLDRKWRDYSGSKLILFDPAFAHYVQADVAGNISVKRTIDDVPIALLPAPKLAAWLMHFSGDGRYLAVKYHPQDFPQRNRVIVWNVKTAKPVLEFTQLSYSALDFSPDSKSLAMVHLDGAVRIYQLPNGDKPQPLFRGPPAHSIRYDPGGRRLAVSSLQANEVHIHDAENGARLHTFKHATAFRGLAWRGDGRQLAAAGQDSQVYRWNLDVRPGVHAVLKGHDHEVIHVAFNHRGNLLASTSWDSTLRLWDPLTGKQHLTAPLLGPLQFRGDDERLGFFEVANSVGMRRLDLGARVINFECYFSPDAGFLVNSMPEGALVWDLVKKIEPERLQFPGGLWSTLFRPDGTCVITCGGSGLRRWQVRRDKDQGLLLESPETLNGARLGRGAMSHDGRYVAAIVDAARALVYDLEAPAKPTSIAGHPHLGFLDLAPDGRWLATGSWQGRDVMIWDARTGKRLTVLPIASSAVVAFSPDGQWLATGSDSDVRVWRTGSWQLAYEKRRERNGPVAFSPRGGLLAFTQSLSTVRLLAPDTGVALATLETPYPAGLSWLRFSNDGNQLAASADYMLQLWNLAALRRELTAMKLNW
ncbi:MAG: hypothetical protein FJ271_03685 [Planctomycetes bacterium]|nr:hypothetical protein [Planctomycetota bacterium]